MEGAMKARWKRSEKRTKKEIAAAASKWWNSASDNKKLLMLADVELLDASVAYTFSGTVIPKFLYRGFQQLPQYVQIALKLRVNNLKTPNEVGHKPKLVVQSALNVQYNNIYQHPELRPVDKLAALTVPGHAPKFQ
jgi:hypothetical protein